VTNKIAIIFEAYMPQKFAAAGLVFEGKQPQSYTFLEVIFVETASFCCLGFQEKAVFQQSTVIRLLI
jgi:hypothetical protein